MSNQFIDLTNKTIGEWKVIEYKGNGKWLCKCSCGTEKILDGHELRRGATKSCGHNKIKTNSLVGKTIGEWTVLGKGSKERHLLCKCSCGEIKEVHSYSLSHEKSLSCGHDSGKLKDMKGQKFGDWTVLRYDKDGKWICKCSCGTERSIHGTALRLGNTKSCGCKNHKNRLETLLANKGDFKPGEKREIWQIMTLNDKELLIRFIEDMSIELGRKVTNQEIADRLGVTRTGVYEATKKFGIEDYKLDKYHSLKIQQKEVSDYIKSIYTKEIIEETRKIIPPQEIDIYIPDKKIAIEFNGDYWHSYPIKSKNYHQQKTIACARKGIQLIHIFEHEWLNDDVRRKIKEYIKDLLSEDCKIVYARLTEIREISKEESKEFLNKHHLQNDVPADIRVGCFDKEQRLIGVMTFGKPRFTNDYEYEILRMCWKTGYKVIGGLEKMFSYFKKKHKPNSILTYSDISKFTGNSYLKIGFKVLCITEPNYVWVDRTRKEVFTRYQTTKQKLISAGLGDIGETEDEIMQNLGYLKVYNSGNMKLEFRVDR